MLIFFHKILSSDGKQNAASAKAGARGVRIVALSIKSGLLFSNIVGSLYF